MQGRDTERWGVRPVCCLVSWPTISASALLRREAFSTWPPRAW